MQGHTWSEKFQIQPIKTTLILILKLVPMKLQIPKHKPPRKQRQ